MIFQIGKSGRGYLLNKNTLSANSNHIGGESFSAAVCDLSFGGVAYANGWIYVGCLNGLHALQLNGSTFTQPWSVTTTRYGPPIVSGGIVWSLQINNGILDGFDVATGARKFSLSVGSLTHFMTPTASNGQIFVASSNQVKAYGQGAGPYHPLPPTRILDTRTGNGGYNTPVGNGQTINLQVTGRGGVPASGARPFPPLSKRRSARTAGSASSTVRARRTSSPTSRDTSRPPRHRRPRMGSTTRSFRPACSTREADHWRWGRANPRRSDPARPCRCRLVAMVPSRQPASKRSCST